MDFSVKIYTEKSNFIKIESVTQHNPPNLVQTSSCFAFALRNIHCEILLILDPI